MKIISRSLIIIVGMLFAGMDARAEEALLWNANEPQGQWRAFGAGTKDSREFETGGVSLVVDWPETTFGAGAVYEGDEEFPDLSGYRWLRFQARTDRTDGTQVTPEWVDRATEQSFRSTDARGVTAEWQDFEFALPDDFPKLVLGSNINALRLLFLNREKEGRNTIYFREVRLEP